jgi:hypothetical protein
MNAGARFALCSMLPLIAACNRVYPVQTEPYPVSATAAIDRNDVEVPRELEVRSASYSLTGLANVSGYEGNTGTTVQLRPLLTIYAVNRSTGEQLLLIYDDLAQRKQPSRIIRIRPASDSGRIGR